MYYSLLVYVLCFIPINVNAVVFQCETWFNGRTGQRLFACSDFHTAHKADKKQVSELASFLMNDNMHLIVEDYDPAQRLFLPASGSRFLRSLDYVSSYVGIDTTYLEFRHNYPWEKTQTHMSELDEVVQEIERYDDGDILNTYYESTLMGIDCVYKPLYTELKQFDGSILSYQLKSTIYNALGKPMPTYSKLHGSTHLIDLRILHAVAQKKHNDLCICAGANHIERVKTVLPDLGFNRYDRVGLKKQECLDYYQRYLQVPAVDFNNVLPLTGSKNSSQCNLNLNMRMPMSKLPQFVRFAHTSKVATAITLFASLLVTTSYVG
jgi:hypothetical protein